MTSTLADCADALIERGLHPLLLHVTGIDMVELEVKVAAQMPPFTVQTALIVAVASSIAWFLLFLIIHYMLVVPFMSYFKHLEVIKPFHALKPDQQRYYSSHLHAIVHAAVSSFLAYLCFFYADGKPHTNWFNDDHYKLHCFDMQKHSMFVTVGYFLYDIIFCYFNNDSSGDTNASAWQNYAHHLMGLGGYALTLKCGGLLASICQLTAITEIATLTVDFRVILAYHNLSKSLLYAANGLTMTLHFFVFRVVFYLWMVFGVLGDFFVYGGRDTWRLFPDEVHVYVVLSISLYLMMIVLNLYWFNRMLRGLLKGLRALSDRRKSEKKRD